MPPAHNATTGINQSASMFWIHSPNRKFSNFSQQIHQARSKSVVVILYSLLFAITY